MSKLEETGCCLRKTGEILGRTLDGDGLLIHDLRGCFALGYRLIHGLVDFAREFLDLVDGLTRIVGELADLLRNDAKAGSGRSRTGSMPQSRH